MVDAVIHDKDVVYIRIQPEVENGEIAAVRIDGEATLKRVYYNPGTLTLMPANPAYAPMILSLIHILQQRCFGGTSSCWGCRPDTA